MKNNALKNFFARSWKVLAGIAGMAILLIWTTGMLRQRVEPGVLNYRPGMPVPEDAERIDVRLQPIPTRIDVMGTVTSDDNIRLSARISSYVSEVHAAAGHAVTNQQVLIRLDDREMKQQLGAAKAHLRQAVTELERTRILFSSDAATRQQMIAAESAEQASRARVDEINVLLTYSEIRSPINGIITDRSVEPGMLVQPGQALLSVYNHLSMRLDVPVPVRMISQLELQQAVTVQLESPKRTVTGRISEIVSEIDTSSRTRLVKVRMDATDSEMIPGSFGRLSIEQPPHDGYLVPSSSVYNVGQLEMVQVISDDRVIRRLVKTGPAMDGQVELLSGVRDGDNILSQPRLEH